MATMVSDVGGRTESSEQVYSVVGERLRSSARAFRLRFHGCLGKQRALRGPARAAMESLVHADKDMLHLSKSLFSKNVHLRRLSQAASELREYFKRRTFPFDESVRILYARAASVEQERLRINEFINEMGRLIRLYQDAALIVCDEWPAILREAREKLKDLFDPSDYPTEERLRTMFRIEFVPVNVELPQFYAGVPREEYERALQQVRDRFAQAAALAEVTAVKTLEEALNGLVTSLKGYEDGKQKTVKFTRMEGVLEAFKQCREKYREVGLLSSCEFENAFENLRRVLSEFDTPEAFDDLRKDKALLVNVRQKTETLIDQLRQSAEPIRRRAVRFLEGVGYDVQTDE